MKLPGKAFGFTTVLFAGVFGAVGGGLLLGGHKLHHVLKVRNKESPLVIPEEMHDGNDGNDGDSGSFCPMSHNFEGIFERNMATDSSMFKDLGGRIAH